MSTLSINKSLSSTSGATVKAAEATMTSTLYDIVEKVRRDCGLAKKYLYNNGECSDGEETFAEESVGFLTKFSRALVDDVLVVCCLSLGLAVLESSSVFIDCFCVHGFLCEQYFRFKQTTNAFLLCTSYYRNSFVFFTFLTSCLIHLYLWGKYILLLKLLPQRHQSQQVDQFYLSSKKGRV